MHVRAIRLSLPLLLRIALHSREELLSAARQADVLDSDVDALLHVAVADLLVDDHADCAAGHVVDDARLAVVHFVGHALLDGAVGFDVDDVSDSVGGGQYAGEGGCAGSGCSHLYGRRKVDRLIIPFFLWSREKA
jgi:hypothetical protein